MLHALYLNFKRTGIINWVLRRSPIWLEVSIYLFFFLFLNNLGSGFFVGIFESLLISVTQNDLNKQLFTLAWNYTLRNCGNETVDVGWFCYNTAFSHFQIKSNCSNYGICLLLFLRIFRRIVVKAFLRIIKTQVSTCLWEKLDFARSLYH